MPINAHLPRRPFRPLGEAASLAVALGLTFGVTSTASAATTECYAPVTAVSSPEKGARGDVSPILFRLAGSAERPQRRLWRRWRAKR